MSKEGYKCKVWEGEQYEEWRYTALLQKKLFQKTRWRGNRIIFAFCVKITVILGDHFVSRVGHRFGQLKAVNLVVLVFFMIKGVKLNFVCSHLLWVSKLNSCKFKLSLQPTFSVKCFTFVSLCMIQKYILLPKNAKRRHFSPGPSILKSFLKDLCLLY